MITPLARDGHLRGADVDEEFMALVCADEELLAAEFEAVIAAGWSPPTAVPRGGGTWGPAEALPHDFVCRGCRPSLRPSRLPGRQRSPPVGARTARTT
ncbi:hypothetical protein [Terrabacter sp. 2YAF2]|uniref:hypothetical protein n=1 Tax=Terrabacter sp. 2YAF2 TaxID=3233026 RepID=UPI003F97C65B